jgi:hypothetical protein
MSRMEVSERDRNPLTWGESTDAWAPRATEPTYRDPTNIQWIRISLSDKIKQKGGPAGSPTRHRPSLPWWDSREMFCFPPQIWRRSFSQMAKICPNLDLLFSRWRRAERHKFFIYVLAACSLFRSLFSKCASVLKFSFNSTSSYMERRSITSVTQVSSTARDFYLKK